jgi:polyhydroxybutyrate depolymerase
VLRQRVRLEAATARGCLGASLLWALACASDRRNPSASEAPLGAAPATASASDACASPGLPGGQSEQRISSGGMERRFSMVLPSLRAPGERLPVVFNLHGSGGSPEGQLAQSGLGSLAQAERFIVVAPAALDGRWNVPPLPEAADDVRFISDIIDALPRLACIDAERVYATGFSGGGRMSSQLACDLSERIGAIAAVGGIRFPGPCSAARAIPVLAIHGTADAVNPYAGGGQPYWGYGVEAAIDGWARHNACTGPTETELEPGVWQVKLDCAAGARGPSQVILYRLDGVDHVWPGVILPAAPRGTANHMLWDFFQSHPLPAPG